jgi:hypothetical protein
MREQLNRVTRWFPSDPAREQVWAQNRADEQFEWDCNQAKLLGFTVSPIRRSLRNITDEDGRPYMCHYYLRAVIDGPEQEMQHLKDIIDKKCPPVYAELLENRDLLRAKR